MVKQSSKATQNSLFPETETAVVYEQPLNERVRSFLRLEHLFDLVQSNIEGETEFDARAAIAAMIDVTDLLLRTDIKAELIKELDRQFSILSPLAEDPRVDNKRLSQTLGQIQDLTEKLRSGSYQPGQTLRNDELIIAIKQRLAIPGGTCNFDLPAFHFWLTQPLGRRQKELASWFADLRVLRESVLTALSILRESAAPTPESADGGFFQQTLDTSVRCQLIRIGLPPASDVFPEISAGKHRFTVRFLEQGSTNARPFQTTQAVSFVLEKCSL